MMDHVDSSEAVFPFEIWTIVDRYIPLATRINLSTTCKTLRALFPPNFECVTLTLADPSLGTGEYINERLLRKIDFFTSPRITLSVKACRLNFHTQRVPSLPTTPEACTPLFLALAKFENLTDLDCFRILFNQHHANILASLRQLIHAEFTECQWMYRQHIPFENRMRLRHLLVDHGPNKHRYNWLFNTHPSHLISLVLSSGMPAGLISGFLPPLPNLELLEINGIAILHPEFPLFLSLCPGLIELRVTTDSLWPSYARAAEGVMAVVPSASIPDLRIYEGPVKFLPAVTRGRLISHVGVYACPLFMKTFTIKVGSAFNKRQIRSLKIRVPRVTDQILALLSYFQAVRAVEIVVTNEDQPPQTKQTFEDVLVALDESIFPPPPKLEYLSIAEEMSTWGVPKESPWYSRQRQQLLSVVSDSPSLTASAQNFLGSQPLSPIPDSPFIKKCPVLQYVMLSNDSGVVIAWDPCTGLKYEETKTIRQWQRHRLGLFDPKPY